TEEPVELARADGEIQAVDGRRLAEAADQALRPHRGRSCGNGGVVVGGRGHGHPPSIGRWARGLNQHGIRAITHEGRAMAGNRRIGRPGPVHTSAPTCTLAVVDYQALYRRYRPQTFDDVI